jgi:hypothetical protein
MPPNLLWAHMGTKPAAVTRLESSLRSGKHSPSLATLRKRAAHAGRLCQACLSARRCQSFLQACEAEGEATRLGVVAR